MKKNIFISIIFALSLVVVPLSIYAASSVYYPTEHNGKTYYGLLPICNEGTINEATGDYDNPCGIEALMAMINKLIDFVTIKLAAPLFAVLFTYAGVLYMMTVSDPGNKNKAKKIIQNSLLGFGLVLASWVIIKTILVIFDYNGPMFLV